MRCPHRTRLIQGTVTAASLALLACGSDVVPVPGRTGAFKSAADVRAERRAYEGAPPTIPHESFGVTCIACHDHLGRSVTGVGFAPDSPHANTREANRTVRCRQCHVFVTTDNVFVRSEFVGLPQDLRVGGRATPGAPPTIPHRVQLRENCQACHDGPGAREEIRTTHPERRRCRQCHVPVTTAEAFASTLGQGMGEQ